MQCIWKIACLWVIVIVGLPVYGGTGAEGMPGSDVKTYKFTHFNLTLIEEILEAQEAKAMAIRPQDEKVIKAEYAGRLARARAVAAAYAAKLESPASE